MRARPCVIHSALQALSTADRKPSAAARRPCVDSHFRSAAGNLLRHPARRSHKGQWHSDAGRFSGPAAALRPGRARQGCVSGFRHRGAFIKLSRPGNTVSQFAYLFLGYMSPVSLFFQGVYQTYRFHVTVDNKDKYPWQLLL